MIKKWIGAFRLRTLPLAFSSILMGTAFSIYEGYFSFQVFALTLLTTLLLQILSNLANDYADGVKGTDKDRIGEKRAVSSGTITANQMKRAVQITGVLSFLTGIALLYSVYSTLGVVVVVLFLGLGVASILAAVFYTVGKKAYGYNALGDLFVFVFFGLVGVVGSSYLQTGFFNPLILIPASAIGLLAVAVLNLNNMRDVENDLKFNKITVAIKLGKRAIHYHLSLILTAMTLYLMFVFMHQDYKFFLSLLPFLILINHLNTVMKIKNREQFDPELKKIALSSFLVSSIYLLAHLI